MSSYLGRIASTLAYFGQVKRKVETSTSSLAQQAMAGDHQTFCILGLALLMMLNVAIVLFLIVLNLLPRDRANIVVAQCARGYAVDPHDQAACRVWTGYPRIRLHPICRMVLALFGWQQWDGCLQRIEAKIGPIGQAKLAAAHKNLVAYVHRTGAVAFNPFDHDLKVI